MTGRRGGRRPGSPDTRGAVLASARTLFAERGFTGTSVRAVAEGAGVDAALVHHYFGTKRELFLAAVAIPLDPAVVLGALHSVPRAQLGETVVRAVIGFWDGDHREAGIALLRAQLTDPESTILRTFIGDIIAGALGANADLDPDTAATRTALVASQIGGILLLRYIVGLDPIASMSVDELAAHIGPTVQRYLTDPMP
ncbi:TetR family transcriptional regulator [Gordonia amarae]|uniref:TetR family transcriptional regulator n=2 Tax=Gordonia amarae TaxID=36821 RepID=A0A857M6I1_9ACTN|nr:TetR family transcriptional regulator [Gordonia amarae]QHN15706.1 TetR family transcriptional regulator [Gordonia amarae]QHN20275.1 TetR family transcriptional regulator [Gordonia amarae]QHN37906.1 TetR family transcriptional regulator [Gordonia amarae]GAB07475.1 putative TetR family transcriptional regulator [Gordonia amarae NBRC 15530]